MTARARYLGYGVIVSSWAVLAYLVAYYAVLLAFGPDRLHAALGAGAYNRIFPPGGFTLLLSILVLGVVWAIPFGLFFVGVAGMARWVAPRKPLRWRLRAAAAVAVPLTAALHFGSLDGWPWAAFPYVVGDDTHFAPGYSALGFWNVRAGMTAEDVVARAGEPLERYPIDGHPDEEGWRWTRSPHSSHYRIRSVLFRQGHVVERSAEFYWD